MMNLDRFQELSSQEENNNTILDDMEIDLADRYYEDLSGTLKDLYEKLDKCGTMASRMLYSRLSNLHDEIAEYLANHEVEKFAMGRTRDDYTVL